MNQNDNSAAKMTQEEIDSLRKKGQLAYKPFYTPDGKHMVTKDGMIYNVLEDGSIRRMVETPRRMSKKERRKWRDQLAVDEAVAALHKQLEKINTAQAEIAAEEVADGPAVVQPECT